MRPSISRPTRRLARDKARAKLYPGGFDQAAARRALDQHLFGADADHVLPLAPRDRDRVFNLGYFTWVEQQGLSLAEFEARRPQSYWTGLRDLVPVWDDLIRRFNEDAGVTPAR